MIAETMCIKGIVATVTLSAGGTSRRLRHQRTAEGEDQCDDGEDGQWNIYWSISLL